MALSFANGSWTLAQWGFGAGDIATIAGAGRAVGTWFMAQIKDRSLLDFLGLDTETVLTRRGLIDVTKLHERWDRKLILLKNARPFVLEHPAGTNQPVVGSVDRFTWLMMLLVGSLDASLTTADLRELFTHFVMELFADSPNGTEYIQRDVYQNIQGWQSSACVRGILRKARKIWSDLEHSGRHLPGNIPSNEKPELLQLLLWLTTGRDQVFRTASSDVFCIAVIMQNIGVEIIATTQDNAWEISESVPCVIYDISIASRSAGGPKCPRWGMRIPLSAIAECVSGWPCSQGANNELRRIFEDGMDAVDEDSITVHLEIPSQAYVFMTGANLQLKKRLENYEVRAASVFLPKNVYFATRKLGSMIRRWASDDRAGLDIYLRRFDTHCQFQDDLFDIDNHISETAFAQLQVFLLGFYYRVILPLIDFSTLSRAEAFGSWTYGDTSFFRQVLMLGSHNTFFQTIHSCTRSKFICFAAYLFAGADLGSTERAMVEEVGCVGILGKLSLLSYACLGSIRKQNDVSKLHLLDIDMTLIPSTSRGLVTEGQSHPFESVGITHSYLAASEVSVIGFDNVQTDFTVHIEPDWDNDVQACLVVYRHQGRLVHRLPPSLLEAGIWQVPHDLTESFQEHKRTVLSGSHKAVNRLIALQVENVRGGRIIRPENVSDGLVLCTYGLPRAQTCILGMYANLSELMATSKKDSAFVPIASPEDLRKATDAGMKRLIISDSIEFI